MKTIATLLFTMILGSTVLFAQTPGTVPPPPSPVQWNETIHDFGKLKQNDPGAVTFSMKNISEAPVIITQARSSCGCTVAEYTKEPVKPGESGSVKATYNTSRVGPFTKTVTVTIEGFSSPQILTIKGEVIAPPAAPAETATPAPGTK